MKGGEDELVLWLDRDLVLALLLGLVGQGVLRGDNDGGGERVLLPGTTSEPCGSEEGES